MTKLTIWWVRKDFRLADNPALHAAIERGDAVLPLFILDPVLEAQLGAAPRWRLSRGIRTFSEALEERGSRLILHKGDALTVLQRVIDVTGATGVVWGRQYDGDSRERDTDCKSALKEDGIEAISVRSHLLIEPWEIETKSGGPYRVYSPFKRTFFEQIGEVSLLPAPDDLCPPSDWPRSDELEDWGLEEAMNRGGEVVADHARIGEAAARERLDGFLDRIGRYKADRDFPDIDGTSRLSENLAWGEIGPGTIWHAAKSAIDADPDVKKGATVYLQEIIWREFAYHLLYHWPEIATRNWREEWDAFPWRDDNDDAERWRRGRTGIPVIDAAMRELYTTGYMHNRMRMLTASFLTKHLLTDWRVGEAWFRDCLIDWDPASNAMGWQWVAGSGPDAAPFFRIFNPETQREKFDPDEKYVGRWVAEGAAKPSRDALRFFEAIPRSWEMSPDDPEAEPVVALDKGRKAALKAYEEMRGEDD